MKEIPVGTIRIKTKDLLPYEKTKKSWKRSKSKFPEALRIIKLFKAHKNLDILTERLYAIALRDTKLIISEAKKNAFWFIMPRLGLISKTM